MSKLWLPFYDIGGSVGKGQANHPMDMALCQYMFLRTTHNIGINLGQQNAWAFANIVPGQYVMFDWAGTKGDKWIKFAENIYRTAFGATIAPLESGVIRPYGQEKGLVLAMNKKFHQLHAAEYINPSFGNAGSSVSSASLLWHMLLPGSMRSEWLGISAVNAGPQREIPFYDVKTLIQYPPGNWNQFQVVDPLAGYLFKIIYNGHSKARPEDMANNVLSSSANVAVNAAVIPKFTKRFIELGWNCADLNNIHPTKGNLNSLSSIVPANYFAHMVAMGKTISGIVSPAHFAILNSPGLVPQTKQCMFDCRESRYFEVAPR